MKRVTYLGHDEIGPLYQGHDGGNPVALGEGEHQVVSDEKAAQLERDFPDAFQIKDADAAVETKSQPHKDEKKDAGQNGEPRAQLSKLKVAQLLEVAGLVDVADEKRTALGKNGVSRAQIIDAIAEAKPLEQVVQLEPVAAAIAAD